MQQPLALQDPPCSCLEEWPACSTVLSLLDASDGRMSAVAVCFLGVWSNYQKSFLELAFFMSTIDVMAGIVARLMVMAARSMRSPTDALSLPIICLAHHHHCPTLTGACNNLRSNDPDYPPFRMIIFE